MCSSDLAKAAREQFREVMVNGKRVRLLNSKRLTVCDALIEAGIAPAELLPRTGKSLLFKLDEDWIRIKGEAGQPAHLTCNDRAATIETPIENGDQIGLTPASCGTDAYVNIKDYIRPSTQKTIYLGEGCIGLPLIYVNGHLVNHDYTVKHHDEVVIEPVATVGALLKALKKDLKKPILMVNLEEVTDDYYLQDNDHVLFQEGVRLPIAEKTQELPPDTVVYVNDEAIQLPYREQGYMFINVFDYIEFDLTKPQGYVQLLLNGNKAAATDTIMPGDKLHIYWEN